MAEAPNVWYTRCPVPNALSIAIRLGWLEEELTPDGVAVRSLAAHPEPAARQAHFAQDLGGLIRHGGNVPPLVARSRGADVRVVGLSWTDFHEPVVVRADDPAQGPADLRGRRVSVPRRTADAVDFWRATALHGYARALAGAGLTLDDVELVDLEIGRSHIDGPAPGDDPRAPLWGALGLLGQQREEALALLTGRVDAVFTHASLAPALLAFTGGRVLEDVGAAPDRARRVNNGVPLVLTVTGDLVDERPDVVDRILARVLSAARWAARHKDEATRIVADEVGLAPALVPLAYSGAAAGQLDVDLSPERLAGLESQAAWLHEHGFLERPISLDELVDPEPLRRARALQRRAPASAVAA